MNTARIAELLEPFLEKSLSPSQLDQISTYIDLLLRWNARINLTAIRQEEEIVPRHFGESLFMARHLFEAGPTEQEGSPSKLRLGGGFRVLDIGSGAGFPALPLKIWAPEIHLTLIESNHKKAAFLREVSRALTLTNVDVLTDRAETLAAHPGFPRTEIVTLRAVEIFDTILPQAAALLLPNGRLALLIGAPQLPRLTTLLGVKWNPPLPVPQSQARVLSIGVLL
jgi:16S rRNA (guanine527-N7)-methyltransferase